MTPTCCGRRATPYKKMFSLTREFGLTWESGFRCRRCGRVRIPAAGWVITAHQPETQAQLDAIREEGMRFDASLNQSLLLL